MKADEKRSRVFYALGMAAAIASIVMMLAAAMMPWADLDGSTKVGPISVSLDADLLEYGIDYTADLGNLSNSSIFSGLGNRIPSEMSGNKAFLTGLGEFQETIGFVKGTSKEKVIYGSTYTWPPPQNGTAELRVTTRVKTIPWWPVGLAQDAGMTIEITGAVNMSELKVGKLTFELHRLIDGQDKYKVVHESSPGDILTKVGDSRTYWTKITVDENIGEFTLVGKFELALKDKFGSQNSTMFFPSPREIKLWTMSPDKTAEIALMAGAFPVTIIGAIILAVGATMGLFANGRPGLGRLAWKLCLAGCILSILAIPFYVMGVNALVDLTGYTSWLSWRPVFYLAIAGACLSVMPAVLCFLVRPPLAPKPPKARERVGKEAAKTFKKKSEHPQHPPTNIKSGNT